MSIFDGPIHWISSAILGLVAMLSPIGEEESSAMLYSPVGLAEVAVIDAEAQPSDTYLKLMMSQGVSVGCYTGEALALYVEGVAEGGLGTECWVLDFTAGFERRPEFQGWKFLQFPEWADDFRDWAEGNSPGVLFLEEQPYLPTRAYTFYVGGCALSGLWPFPIDPHYLEESVGRDETLVQANMNLLPCLEEQVPAMNDPRIMVATAAN